MEPSGLALREELKAAARPGSDGRPLLLLSAPAISCGQCIATVERGLAALPEVGAARVNLTTRRIAVTLAAPDSDPVAVVTALERLGYPATPVEPGPAAPPQAPRQRLLRALAVAGFGASNVMLLSVAVWAGADPDMRGIFHALSAAIALPVIAYSGQPFFASALAGLRAGRLNMDLPISVGVLLTLGLSLYEALSGGEHVFFDAAVTLLFFLLAGRYLDALMRERAASAVTGLARLAARGGTVVEEDGSRRYLPLDAIRPGMVLAILPGDRVPVDVRILSGGTDLDRAIVTGESAAVAAGPGDEVEAGSLNLTGAVEALALRPAGASFLAEVARMLEAAEHGRGRHVLLADRVARLYAPVVHLVALATLAGWVVASGGDWHLAVFNAVAVLIITCPCALGLAVPAVHVVASGRLFREGIMLRDGSALERLAEVGRAVFDKTGTLTTGTPRVEVAAIPSGVRAALRALALRSTHPVSRAVAAALPEAPMVVAEARELPGRGIEALVGGRRARLGRADWVAGLNAAPALAGCCCAAVDAAPAAADSPPRLATPKALVIPNLSAEPSPCCAGPAPVRSAPTFALEVGPPGIIPLAGVMRPQARQAEAGVAARDAAAAVAAQAGTGAWREGREPAGKPVHLAGDDAPALTGTAFALEGGPLTSIPLSEVIRPQARQAETGVAARDAAAAVAAQAGTGAWREGREPAGKPVHPAGDDAPPLTGTAFALEGGPLTSIPLSEVMRPQARETVARLAEAGVAAEVVSGDAAAAVAAVAAQAGIAEWRAGCTPAEKVAHLQALAAGGQNVLMVGDGLNDAPALAAAHVSMAPASASDIGRMAADLVFTRPGLEAVAIAHDTARRAARLVRQNLALALVYNAVAVPIAAAGLVTPLIAALAMSGSSILVVGNALRLNGRGLASLWPTRPAPLRERRA